MKTRTPHPTAKIDISKTRKDGLAPVYIHVNWINTRAKEATGLYIQPDQLKNNVIRGNSRANNALQRRLAEIEETIARLAASGADYTAADALAKAPTRPTPLNIIARLTAERGSSAATANSYLTALHAIQKAAPDADYWTLSTDEWKGIAKRMETNGLSLSSIGHTLTSAAAIYNYAKINKLTDKNPLESWRYRSDGYRPNDNPRALSSEQIADIINIATHPTNYRPQLVTASKTWLCGYFFGGMALVDLMAYDWAKIEQVFDGNTYAFALTYYRRKTGQKATISTPCTPLTRLLLAFLQSRPWGGRNAAAFGHYINAAFSHTSTPADIRGITYYTARHSFCTALVNSNSVAINDIATLMGRSVNGIGTYIKQVTAAEHLVKATAHLPGLNSRITDSYDTYDPDFDPLDDDGLTY